MKVQYEVPEIILIEFEDEDIIRMSYEGDKYVIPKKRL